MGYTSTAEAIITIGAGPEYALQRGESGFEIVLGGKSYELNAALCIMLGAVALILGFSGKTLPILKPKMLKVLAIGLLIVGLGFYVA
jgi:hypothetical protein